MPYPDYTNFPPEPRLTVADEAGLEECATALQVAAEMRMAAATLRGHTHLDVMLDDAAGAITRAAREQQDDIYAAASRGAPR